MMLKDPQASRDGAVPYDLLAEGGIGPGSSMKEILDASFLLMEQGRWSPEVRRAWDELRSVERRLAVDFLLYDVDIGTAASSARQAVLAALGLLSRTDPAELCDLTPCDLTPCDLTPCDLTGELREITLAAAAVPDTTAFDQPPPLPGPDIVEFDR